MTGILIFRWWKHCKEEKILEKRPDTSVLVFSVYLLFALSILLYFFLIIDPPVIDTPPLGGIHSYFWYKIPPSMRTWYTPIPKSWVWSWLRWTLGFIILTIFLGIGYIFINREIEVVNTYFYDNRTLVFIKKNTSGLITF